MATDNPFHSQPRSIEYTIAVDGLIGIFATGRRKATGRDVNKYPRIKRNVPLVETDGGEDKGLEL